MSRARIIRSVNLDRKEILKIARYYDRHSFSSVAILRRGRARECLKTMGKLPVESERFDNFGDYGNKDRGTVS